MTRLHELGFGASRALESVCGAAERGPAFADAVIEIERSRSKRGDREKELEEAACRLDDGPSRREERVIDFEDGAARVMNGQFELAGSIRELAGWIEKLAGSVKKARASA